MNLSELSIKRPVFAVVCSIVIIIFGAIGFSFLGIREYPAIDPPVVNVRASYVGANAEIIEQQLTEPLEKAVNGVEGVKNITSSSSQGSCNINVEVELASFERAGAQKFLKFNGTILDFYNYAEEFFYKTPSSVRKDNRGRPKKVLNQPLPRVLQPNRGRGRPKKI